MKISDILMKLSLYAKRCVHSETPGIHVTGNASAADRILLYLDNCSHMHPGDHLFFEPLSRHLSAECPNYALIPVSNMKRYFKSNNHPLIEKLPPNGENVLLITKSEFASNIPYHKDYRIVIDTMDHRINRPLCNYLLEHIPRILGIGKCGTSGRPSPKCGNIQTISKYIHKNERYAILNNYISSGAFRISRNQRQRLYKKSITHAKTHGCTLIITGTKEEKTQDPLSYDSSVLDLRGLSTIEDMFWLIAQENIESVFTFDNFVMHLASINSKPVNVMFRGRFTKAATEHLKNNINIPFETNDHKINYIT